MDTELNGRVAVVIPYFQRQPGILRKAVASALAQAGGPPRIVIVDDSSPVPAQDEVAELAALVAHHPGRITIIRQPNGGPAAARNRALSALATLPALGEGIDYIAFLDSDDVWTEDHLAHAQSALDSGYDFYFADHYQLNQEQSAFQRAGRIRVAEHPAIGAQAHLHLRAYAGDMQEQIISGNIIGTSTVVYRAARFASLRFREEFVYAGEDYLFWLELVRAGARIAFSDQPECRYGTGVNIFSGSGWGTEKSLVRLHHEIKYRKALSRLFELSAPQRTLNRHTLSTLRRSFVADLLHRLRHHKPIDRALLGRQWFLDPQTFLFALPIAVRILLHR
jgi:succinoglycan biosynthesis protein ExoW